MIVSNVNIFTIFIAIDIEHLSAEDYETQFDDGTFLVYSAKTNRRSRSGQAIAHIYFVDIQTKIYD
jgi:hypothetical protein